jgi:hypothetical protein
MGYCSCRCCLAAVVAPLLGVLLPLLLSNEPDLHGTAAAPAAGNGGAAARRAGYSAVRPERLRLETRQVRSAMRRR